MTGMGLTRINVVALGFLASLRAAGALHVAQGSVVAFVRSVDEGSGSAAANGPCDCAAAIPDRDVTVPLPCCDQNHEEEKAELERSVQAMKDTARIHHEAQMKALARTQDALKEALASKDAEIAARTSMALRDTSAAAAAGIDVPKDGVAEQAAEKARQEIAREYAAIDTVRNAREVATTVRQQQVDVGSKQLDARTVASINSIADSTAAVVAKTAAAAESATLAKAEGQAAATFADRLRLQDVEAKVLAATAAAAKERAEEIQRQAEESQRVAASTNSSAARERERVHAASDVLAALQQELEADHAEAARSVSDATDEIVAATAKALEDIQKAVADGARSVNEASRKLEESRAAATAAPAESNEARPAQPPPCAGTLSPLVPLEAGRAALPPPPTPRSAETPCVESAAVPKLFQASP
mmetsp:Transcript_19778/g.54493  ORF Transcript_19778/g.54493 Transcript_19778/m.54493 type:complete len:418 (-) Transcript_19778:127-1380(-)